MIWFVAEKFDSHNVSIDGEQVEKFILVYSLGWMYNYEIRHGQCGGWASTKSLGQRKCCIPPLQLETLREWVRTYIRIKVRYKHSASVIRSTYSRRQTSSKSSCNSSWIAHLKQEPNEFNLLQHLADFPCTMYSHGQIRSPTRRKHHVPRSTKMKKTQIRANNPRSRKNKKSPSKISQTLHFPRMHAWWIPSNRAKSRDYMGSSLHILCRCLSRRQISKTPKQYGYMHPKSAYAIMDTAWLMDQTKLSNWVNNMNPFPKVCSFNLLSTLDVAIM